MHCTLLVIQCDTDKRTIGGFMKDFVLKYNRIDWQKSINVNFRVKYDNIIYTLTYLETINKNYVKVEYNDKEYVLTKGALLNGQIGKIIDTTHYGFRYCVGDIINERIILEQIKSPKKNGTYEKRYKVKCVKDNYCYEITEIMLKNNSKCPVCCNRILMVGVNDLWSKRPDIAQMLYDKNEGYKYWPSSKHKTSWLCQCCGSVVHGKSIYNVSTYNTVYCPFCNDGFSYPEKLMNAILSLSRYPYSDNKVLDRWDDLGNRVDASSSESFDYHFFKYVFLPQPEKVLKWVYDNRDYKSLSLTMPLGFYYTYTPQSRKIIDEAIARLDNPAMQAYYEEMTELWITND